MRSHSVKLEVRKLYGWWMVHCPDPWCDSGKEGDVFWTQEEAFRAAESHAKHVHGGHRD